ncbi:MAG: hypothetical protein ACI9CD_000680 [Candidatus Deianiraeaceae bacterium]|jgi:hypothetical protein
MKKILIFANESQYTREIIHSLISQKHQIQILTLKPFKNKDIFVNALPLQVSILSMNVANHYNWKYDVIKYDIIINTLTQGDFSTTKQSTVFVNFIHHVTETTKDLGKRIIYMTQKTPYIDIQSTKNNKGGIFYIDYGFIVENNCKFIMSIMNAKCLLTSKKTLKSKVDITSLCDIQDFITQIISEKCNIHNTYMSGETFTVKDIYDVIQKYSLPKKTIIIPHFLLRIIVFFLNIIPTQFIPKYLSKEIFSSLLAPHSQSQYERYKNYTLLSSIIEQHSKNLFNPHIE